MTNDMPKKKPPTSREGVSRSAALSPGEFVNNIDNSAGRRKQRPLQKPQAVAPDLHLDTRAVAPKRRKPFVL